MTIRRVLAQSTVTELEPAVQWYSLLFDAEPDARPMEGLVEWHLGKAFGVQIWLEPDRAGHSSMVLDESDLDALADRLTAAGLEHSGIEQVTSSRILTLSDPDGNRIVLSGQ